MLVLLSITKFQSFPCRLCARRYFRTKARFSELVPPSPLRAPWVITPRTVLGVPRSTWSHSSPAIGWAGPGNQPDLLATRRAAPGAQWRSLTEEAEIWESGRSPDSIPWSSEQGASERKRMREKYTLTSAFKWWNGHVADTVIQSVSQYT